ncbi:hypothetical protein [Nonomuraea sp. NPDC052265]|uniref:aromatic-ring hydroxylase C-terminal domain-containing protein n=1 Tax=Nonomuraea sp. NPDC052265 TaxID=3364374 RepID=UPI0037CADBAB
MDLAGRDDLVAAAAPWADRLEVVRGSAEHDAEALLVRPDGYTAWTSGARGHSLEAALNRWLGRM